MLHPKRKELLQNKEKSEDKSRKVKTVLQKGPSFKNMLRSRTSFSEQLDSMACGHAEMFLGC